MAVAGRRAAYDAAIGSTISTPAVRSVAPSRAFPTFEGLRALCALGIVAYHAATFTGLTSGVDPGQEWLGSWVHHLNVGVSIFFALSGFLLFRPFVASHLADQPGPSVRRYLGRRAVRIYPAYWVALLLSAWWLESVTLGNWWSALRFLTLTQIYWGETALGGLVQAWTLATEVSFYLFLPVWAALIARVGGTVQRRVRVHYAGLALLIVVGLCFRWALRSGGHAIGYAWLPANIDLFAVGMALAVASAALDHGHGVPAVLRTLGEFPGAAWAAALCCFGAVVALRVPYGFVPTTPGQEVARQALFGTIAFLVITPGVIGDQGHGVIRRALAFRPLVAIGVVSYGLYLWHLTIMSKVFDRWPGPLEGFVRPLWAWGRLTVATTVLSLLLATLSWFVVERPLLRRLRSGRSPKNMGPPVTS